MRKSIGMIVTLIAVAALGIAAFAQAASAEDASAQATYRDIEQTLGSVPSFFKQLPEAGIAGAWAEFKTVQLNPKTKLDGKTKELLGLAVASQIPCHYCVLFHTEAARLNGATEQELQESIFMAALTRQGSTILNGAMLDTNTFDKELRDIVAYLKSQAAKSPTPARR